VVAGVSDGCEIEQLQEQKSKRAKKQKSKKAKKQKIGRHPAGPGRAGVLRIEPAGAVSTLRGDHR